MHHAELHDKTFRLLLLVVSIAFLCVVFPLSGAILWAVTFAILFTPLNHKLLRAAHLGPTAASALTTTLVLVLVILPAVVIFGLIVQEATTMLQKLRSGEIDLNAYYRQFMSVVPEWFTRWLDRAGLGDLQAVQQRIKETAAGGTQPIARQLWTLSQSTLDFGVNFVVMLYLLFFLMRDGTELMHRIKRSTPLEPTVQQRLFRNFAAVVRSTVKGNLVVAAVQGALGGVALMVLGIPGALLWAVVMAFLSLLPAVGAAMVWGPIALYLLAVGEVGKGLGLAAFGAIVIGLVDNLLRPILVGKQTRMPDWLVLVSTIGGMSLFGINGFVVGPVIAALFIAVWDLAGTETADTALAREPASEESPRT